MSMQHATSRSFGGFALAAGLGLAAALAGPATAATREEPMDTTRRLSDDLVFEQDGGESLRLADLKGRPVLVVTWASW